MLCITIIIIIIIGIGIYTSPSGKTGSTKTVEEGSHNYGFISHSYIMS